MPSRFPVADILILGGGFGGLAAATRLGRAAGGRHRVTLVDRHDTFAMGLANLWMLAGLRNPGEGTGDRRRLAADRVTFRKASVRRIDLGGRVVETDTGPLPFDELIVALGAETAPDSIPGLPAENNLYHPLMLPGLRDQLAALDRGRVAIVICGSPYKCPPAPYEAALLTESVVRSKGRTGAVSIAVYVPEPRPMMVAGPAVGAQVRRILEARGVKVHVEHRITAVDSSARTIRFANGNEAAYDLLLAVPPHVAPAVVKAAGLTDASGWIPVDPRTLASAHPHVHAIGDVTSLALPGGGFLPKAGVFAEWEGLLVAERVLHALGEAAHVTEFTGQGECWFETGEGAAMIVHGTFFAGTDARVRLTEPSAEALRLKHEFERTHLAEWFL